MPKSRPSLIILISIALLLAVGMAGYFFRSNDTGTSPGYATRDLRVNGNHVTLQVADTDETRELGLSNRPTMPGDEGMVFTYQRPQPQLCFWMKDMRFPLDMIWLDGERRVVRVAESVKPESYPNTYCSPKDKPAQYVIELNAGQSRTFNIREGVQLSF